MPPDFSRLASSVRKPSADDCDPKRLLLPSQAVVDSTAPTHTAFRLPFQKLSLRGNPQHAEATLEGQGKVPATSTIRLAHVASGRIREVTVKPGPKQHRTDFVYRPGHSRRPSMTEPLPLPLDVDDISVTEITDIIINSLQPAAGNGNGNGNVANSKFNTDHDNLDRPEYQDPRLCEAVLRAIYAPKPNDENFVDLMLDAEAVREAFASLDASVFSTVQTRAQKVAQYRRAEMVSRLDRIQHDDDPFIYPALFDDQEHYEAWKAEETQEVTKHIDFMATFPSFAASVEVEILSGDGFRGPGGSSWRSMFGCAKPPQHLNVYCTVTVLPAKPGNMSSPDTQSDDGRKTAFKTDPVACVDSAEWHAKSGLITVNSMQDRFLIEVWDKLGGPLIGQGGEIALAQFTKSSFKQYLKRKSTRRSKRRKVAPCGDLFLGQIVLSYSHIEAHALAPGRMQGQGPATNYQLMDDRGRESTTTLTLQLACICEHFYKEAPSNKLLLLPPVDDVERSYDVLLRLAYNQQKPGEFELRPQWRRIVNSFANHYGLRKERCSLGIVHLLAGKFNTDAEYLQYVVEEWSPACLAAKEGKLTKTELAVHSSIVVLLMKPTVDIVENFQTVFPKNQPPGALSSLIKLLSLILRWDLSLNEIVVPLRSWIQSFCEKRFHKSLVDDSLFTGEVRDISSQSIIKVVRCIRNDLQEHGSTFVDAFPAACFLPSITAPVYYKLVSDYIKSFVGAASVKTFPKDYVDLAKELLLLHEDIEKLGVPLKFIDVHSLFEDHLTQWLATTKPRMIDWISSIVSAEKWEPLSPHTNAFFSFSVVDLFFMISEVVDEISSRLLSLPFGAQYLPKVEVGICTAIETYVGVVEKLCLDELPEELSTETRGILSRSKSDDKIPPLSISKTLCVKLNDLHAVLEQELDLEKRLESTWGTALQPVPANTTEDSDPDLDFPDLDEEIPGENGVHGAVNTHLSPSTQVGQKFKDLHHYVQQTLTNVIGSIVENVQGRLTSELQYVLRDLDSHADYEIGEQFQPLTEYLDEHLSVMNEGLHPTIFRRILWESAHALMFCMEEFALNRDEDPNPMTPAQRLKLGESLTFFYDYFHGGGKGLSSTEMDEATARLRKILSCWDLGTRELCILYWQAWDKYNNLDMQEKANSPSEPLHGLKPPSHEHVESVKVETELHVLDYLWLLRQKNDDEAQDIVMRQSLIANNKMMQFIFGLPKDEEMVDSFTCRNSRKAQGTLYVTPRHVCFAGASMAAADDRNVFLLSLDRILRVSVGGSSSISIVALNNRPTKFTRIRDCSKVCRVIFKQVAGTGTYLEKYMASTWAKEEDGSNVQQHEAIKTYQCSKHRILSKQPGVLKVSAAHLIFLPTDIEKTIQVDHSSITNIHAGRRGLRASGVVVDLKSGHHLEFVNFSDSKLSMDEIAKELQKVVFGGIVKKNLSEKR